MPLVRVRVGFSVPNKHIMGAQVEDLRTDAPTYPALMCSMSSEAKRRCTVGRV